MDAAAEKLCRSCHSCQVVGELCAPEPMQRVESLTGPWQDVTVGTTVDRGKSAGCRGLLQSFL